MVHRCIEFLLGLSARARARVCVCVYRRVTCGNSTLCDPSIIFSKQPFRVRSHDVTSVKRYVGASRNVNIADRFSLTGNVTLARVLAGAMPEAARLRYRADVIKVPNGQIARWDIQSLAVCPSLPLSPFPRSFSFFRLLARCSSRVFAGRFAIRRKRERNVHTITIAHYDCGSSFDLLLLNVG